MTIAAILAPRPRVHGGLLSNTLRYVIGVLIGLISISPLIVVLFGKSPYYISGEFIAYRFGDSMKLRYSEPSTVRPVQGVPTAILSRALLFASSEIGSHNGISRAELDNYARFYGATLAAIVFLVAVYAWVSVPAMAAAIISLFLIAPWYLGVASMALLLSPDYWMGEWVWLAGTLLISAHLIVDSPSTPNRSLRTLALLGAWIAIGTAIKISLLGAAPLVFFCAITHTSFKRCLIALFSLIAGFLVCYPAILSLYMGSIAQGFQLLVFQIGFFRSPNNSVQYAGWLDALRHKPETTAYIIIGPTVSIALVIYATITRYRMRIAYSCLLLTALWLTIYLFMLARRPHDSTLTSISLSAIFTIAFAVLLFPEYISRFALPIVTATLVGVAWTTHWPAKSELSAIWYTVPGDITAADNLTRTANNAPYTIWFVPTNYWNSTLIPELLGFNGHLALYAVYFDSGHLSYRGEAKIFERLWPNTYLIGADAADFENIKLAVQKGATVFYTKPEKSVDLSVAPEYSRLVESLHSVNCVVVETPVKFYGRDWIFGHSERK